MAKGSISATIAIGRTAAVKVPKTNNSITKDIGNPIISALSWSCSRRRSKSLLITRLPVTRTSRFSEDMLFFISSRAVSTSWSEPPNWTNTAVRLLSADTCCAK